MRIGVFDVFVDDQARARDFYTGVLGCEDRRRPRRQWTLVDDGVT
jgi:catechol 2,3-dioxygenase-like lactoylglutathione lyase family enzyme